MKKIEALLGPLMLEDLKRALGEVGIQEVTAAIVKNFGSGNPHIEQYRGIELRSEFLPQVKAECVVSDADCPRAQEANHVVLKRDGLHDVSGTVLPWEEIICTRTGDIAVAVA